MKIVVHRVCGVGDAVQITPLLQQIRLDYPQAEIIFITSQNATDVVKDAPFVDQVISQSQSSVTPSRSDPLLLKMWMEIRTLGPIDIFIHLGPRWLHSIGAYLVRAKIKAGLSTNVSWRPHPFHTALWFPNEPLLETRHASQVYLDLWTKITGFADRGLAASVPHLGIDPFCLSDLGLKPRFICLAPGAGNWLNPAPSKRWPTPHWRTLMELIITAGWQPVILGVFGDFPKDQLPSEALDLTGRLSLSETASALRQSHGFVGHDSGLFHLALGMSIPAVALFGPTRQDLTGPFRQPHAVVLRAEIPCAPCCRPACILPDAASQSWHGSPPCMIQIQPDRVWAAMQTFLKV
jgi:ADP-heptose:LPS heptosyltransferase